MKQTKKVKQKPSDLKSSPVIKTKASAKPLRPSGRLMVYVFLIFFIFGLFMIGKDIVMIAITGKAYGVDLLERALEKYSVQEVVPTQRGTIYDRTGNPLAEELTSYTLYANLNKNYGLSYVEDIEQTAKVLSEHINLTYEQIYNRLNQDEDVHQVEFGAAGRGLSYVQKQKIAALNLPGINFLSSSTRFYQNDIFASHTLGYAVYDAKESRLVGHMGLELYYDGLLSGQNGINSYIRDRKGYLIPNSKKQILQDAVEGMDIYTTLDFKLQTLLEEALDEADAEYKPESIVGVIAHAKTGEILAVANRKTFNPNHRDVENYYNPLTQHPFEPGSTLKIFTYAAAINEGVNTSYYYYPTGNIKVANMNIKDWKPAGWGTISLDQGFYISANTSIMNILTKHIDTNVFVDYLKAFGFGDVTGIQLPSESEGTLPRENDYTNQLTSGFGQGFLTTPIQHIQGLTAIVNDGNLIKPSLVSKIYDPNTKETTYIEPEVVGQPITASTAQKVRELMYGVVHDEKLGSGYAAYRMEDIAVAGKTGTAQIADIEHGGYLSGQYIYSFAGFAPYDDPEYIFYFAIDRPSSGAMTGHGVLGRALKYILQNSLGYEVEEQGHTSSSETSKELVEVGNYDNYRIDDAIRQAKEQGLTPYILGTGDIVYDQSPSQGKSIVVGDTIYLKTGEVFTVPDFSDWNKFAIQDFARITGLTINQVGVGKVISQSVEPDTLIEAGMTIELLLSLEPDEFEPSYRDEDEEETETIVPESDVTTEEIESTPPTEEV